MQQLLILSLVLICCAAQPAWAAPEIKEQGLAQAAQQQEPSIDFTEIRDPFLSSLEKRRLQKAQRSEQAKHRNIDSRKLEPLEHFDLSNLTLVGTYKKTGQKWVASVQDALGQAYTVHHGGHMGRHEGYVDNIDAHTIYIIENVFNAAGEMVKRHVTLTMNEVNGP